MRPSLVGVVQEEFGYDVRLIAVGPNRTRVIKVLREFTALSIAESVDVLGHLPQYVKEDISKCLAEQIQKKLVEAGAAVEVRAPERFPRPQ